MKKIIEKIQQFLELGGIKKDIVLLVISGISLLLSIFHVVPLPFDIAWVAIVLCGVPIVLEAIIGLITAFDIKADVLVSIALIASVCIREDFAAGEIASKRAVVFVRSMELIQEGMVSVSPATSASGS